MSTSNNKSNSTQFIVPPSIEQSSSSIIDKSISSIQNSTTNKIQSNITSQEIELIIKEKFNEHISQLAEFSNALEKNSEKKINNQTKILKNQIIKTIEQQLADQSKNIESSLITSTTDQINREVKNKTKDLDKIVLKAEDEIKDARNSVFTTIALFAAFFTFISVNVNIFSKASSIEETLIITILMWSCILGFLILFFYFLDKKIQKIYSTFIWGIIILIGIVFLFYGYTLHKKNEALALQYLIKNQTHIPLRSDLLKAIMD
ncbi:hypothetical protein [Acinetobacter sp. YH12105]|uniref:hypothetical protein n=1 Tax=Acinetobacter sp. YH12105 TaxID=2601093 RepID=UPI0015D3B319|nr:hypothetical protein [Acinetobacter sp. YH12105]